MQTSDVNQQNINNASAESGVWLTTAAHSQLLHKQADGLQFGGLDSGLPAIRLDPSQTYQTMQGFGFSLTGGSAYLLSQLPEDRREALLRELYSTEGGGLGVSFLRLTIGASDLSAIPFSYDDPQDGEDDFALSHFDLQAGDVEVVPIVQQILAINPAIRIMAAPWSAPPWMKTSNSFVGGSLRLDCQPAYAQYFVRYIQAMAQQGIPIHAITPQNEPFNHKNQPSMVMKAAEQADFISHHLGPALRGAGLDTQIYCWDHNCDRPEFALNILGDAEASAYTAGSAWHLYGGDIDTLSKIHAAHPDKLIYFTEQWVGAEGQFGGDLLWHGKNVLIGSIRNWSNVVLEWNLAGDPQHGPHTPKGEPNCVGALTIDGQGVERNVAYYLIAHLSKFVPPGSVRIHSEASDGLPHVAFTTPNGTTVLLALNEREEPVELTIAHAGQSVQARLPGQALATLVW